MANCQSATRQHSPPNESNTGVSISSQVIEMAIKKKSLKGVEKAKPSQSRASHVDPDGKSERPPQMILAKKLAMAKLATAKLSTARLVTAKKVRW
jgi:hypothetical protein